MQQAVRQDCGTLRTQHRPFQRAAKDRETLELAVTRRLTAVRAKGARVAASSRLRPLHGEQRSSRGNEAGVL